MMTPLLPLLSSAPKQGTLFGLPHGRKGGRIAGEWSANGYHFLGHGSQFLLLQILGEVYLYGMIG